MDGYQSLKAFCASVTAMAALVAPIASEALAVEAVADEASQTVRGIIRAQTHSTLSSEIVARILQLPFKPGQKFAKGEILVQFDCARYEADLRAARAEERAQKITVDEKRQLLKHRAAGQNELAVAEANLEKASAQVSGLEVLTRQCTLEAPFNGRIADRLVDLYEIPQANAPLLEIVSDGNLEVELIVPSRWMVWLRPDQEFSFEIDETARTHPGRITHVGAVVDPVSRTMKVTGVLLDASDLVRPGMSGKALMRRPNG